MTTLSLREAAEQAGTSKSTIWRAIKSGRISATRLDDGGFAIDPSELFRVFQPERPEQRITGQDATPPTTDETALRLAAMTEEVKGLRVLLEEMKENREELRRSSEAWRAQAERLTIAPPAPAPQPRRRPWWTRWAG